MRTVGQTNHATRTKVHICDSPFPTYLRRKEQVFCTPSMASFLRRNQPWAQLTERGNITIREIDIGGSTGGGGSSGRSALSVLLTPSISFLPVPVPHRAELSDTVAYLVTLASKEEKEAMEVLYCPDTDSWSDWQRGIGSWCEEVDVALLDATFYSKGELKGRDMSEVTHGGNAKCSSVLCRDRVPFDFQETSLLAFLSGKRQKRNRYGITQDKYVQQRA